MFKLASIFQKSCSVFIFTWGLGGIFWIIGRAVLRLSSYVFEAVAGGLSLFEWFILIIWSAWMLIAEGERGFRRGFSPRVVARVLYLVKNPTPLRVLLAPLFCMGFFGTTPRRMRITWILTSAIVCFVLLVKLLEQPWRGIIDAGVVLGLAYGLLWIGIFALQALWAKGNSPYDPEVK